MAKIIKLVLLVSVVCCFYSTLASRPLESFYKAGAGSPTAQEYEGFFQQWHRKFGVGILPTADRQAVFNKRVAEIIAHNQNPKKTFNRTVNKFTGRYTSELMSSAVMQPQNCTVTSGPIKPSTGSAGSSGSYFDWRDKSVVTPIRDQKNCGASYAFAAAAAVESHWGIRTGVPPVMTSEQQSVDCSKVYNNDGCNGGLPFQSFNYIQSVTGLSTENTYPFEAQEGTCRFKLQNVYAKVYNGSINIYPGDELAVFQALSSFGPIAVGMQATDDFLSYDGGIYQSTSCQNNTQMVNHVITIIGYGTDDNTQTDYWIAKNSWGSSWGEEGYVRIKRGTNVCGLANCASYPNLNYTNPITNSTSAFGANKEALLITMME
mmetsp:Transcript_64267/g.74705  ORF Transcript_64267/g.74705 Transcript_64267/m.74705 type:complete len:375 (+) Transcript_64267:32-1156(+)|eukprot:CAMPEP_0176442600 /NCGR_PEP_ID=MMETSP0127-20121128/21918_1 /TAXON_ID=938130 /ORGANISM="Platyophrya macrostoma, Strain WH" /LENGTH=374 /DNA_ID=CAMNT_0017827657 /DNA_START=32 /DNA_END=1156 /DNA_ORIENTATION=-